MKKKWLIAAGALVLLLVLGWFFREPIIDALPIDQSGWAQQNGHTCYLNEKGDRLTGWQTIQGQLFYFDGEGFLSTGWQSIDGGKYYLTDSGTPLTGWQELDGKRYYFLENGAAATGWLEIGENTYYLLPDGVLASGTVEIEGNVHHLTPDGTPLTGWQELDGRRCRLDELGSPLTGWQEIDGSRYYLTETGSPVTGWQELEGRRYYFSPEGIAHSGWLEQDGTLYYLTDTGIAHGKLTVEGKDHFFTSTGAHIVVVNPWNFVPEDYTVDLVNIPGYYGQVDISCSDALNRMLADCRAAGHYPDIASSYRTHAVQVSLHNNMLVNYLGMGYDEETAYERASQIVAVPGTSEHQLGLALDIVDSGHTDLNYTQAFTGTQKWLMEHCWEYGFILRYPDGTTEWTGIIYEPWHYRYVGTELALELRDLGICLEEYLYNLTEE